MILHQRLTELAQYAGCWFPPLGTMTTAPPGETAHTCLLFSACVFCLFVCFWLFAAREVKQEVMVTWRPPRLEPLVKQNMCRFGAMELISQPFQLQGLQYVNLRG